MGMMTAGRRFGFRDTGNAVESGASGVRCERYPFGQDGLRKEDFQEAENRRKVRSFHCFLWVGKDSCLPDSE